MVWFFNLKHKPEAAFLKKSEMRMASKSVVYSLIPAKKREFFIKRVWKQTDGDRLLHRKQDGGAKAWFIKSGWIGSRRL